MHDSKGTSSVNGLEIHDVRRRRLDWLTDWSITSSIHFERLAFKTLTAFLLALDGKDIGALLSMIRTRKNHDIAVTPSHRTHNDLLLPSCSQFIIIFLLSLQFQKHSLVCWFGFILTVAGWIRQALKRFSSLIQPLFIQTPWAPTVLNNIAYPQEAPSLSIIIRPVLTLLPRHFCFSESHLSQDTTQAIISKNCWRIVAIMSTQTATARVKTAAYLLTGGSRLTEGIPFYRIFLSFLKGSVRSSSKTDPFQSSRTPMMF